jgi:tRNA nucleotidyltransferase (CCA-adding enzyme)
MINAVDNDISIIENLIEENKNNIIEIPINKIQLMDKVHLIKEDYLYKKINRQAKRVIRIIEKYDKPMNGVIFVKEVNNQYVLVYGLKWYIVAKTLNKNPKCIVVSNNLDHAKFIRKHGIMEVRNDPPEGTEYYIHDSIIVRSKIKKFPKKKKIEVVFSQIVKNSGLFKPVEVKETTRGNYAIVDGLIGYLWLVEHNEQWIPVKIINE